MNPQLETNEIVVEEFDSTSLPSLEDLMQEFAAEEAPSAAAKAQSISGIGVAAEKGDSTLENVLNDNNAYLLSENEELQATLRRVQSDFDNYRRRTERERSDHYTFAVGTVVREMLPVLDNFSLALQNADALTAEKPDLQQFFQGFDLIHQQLEKVLNVLGVQPVESVGKTFNPHFHEAVSTEPGGENPPNTVIEELLRGYRLGEKLIRPAMVKVST